MFELGLSGQMFDDRPVWDHLNKHMPSRRDLAEACHKDIQDLIEALF